MPQTIVHSSLTESGRAFLQKRVSRFGLLAGSLFGGFWCFRVLTFFFVGPEGTPWASGVLDASMNYHLLAAVCFLAVWAGCAKGQLSAQTIRTIEAVGLIAAAIAANLMASTLPLAGAPDYITLLALSAALTSRAIYVPSTTRRSFVLAAVIGVITLGGIYWSFRTIDIEAWSHVQPQITAFTPAAAAWNKVLNAAIWWGVITAVTTAASDVIYGLRRDARKAKQLGQYKLDQKLGEGGMGVVFMAHHALLARPTAVKLLLPEKAGERSIERFEREVRLMSRLRHPNTVTIFDYGRSPDGVFYYAMEYIDGATLDEIVATTGPIEPARALNLLRQVAAAMVEAHGIGLIHRDIKPSNLMVYLPHSHGGIEEAVKVLDFGLVKDVASDDVGLTQAGALTGTPQYLAPEAIRNPDAVEARSDIYAIGCVFFYLLTGEHLFDGESIMDVCAKHLHQAPDTIAERTGEAVDAQLEELLSACVAKDPADRPASALELQNRLIACKGLGEFTAHDANEWWEEYGTLFDQEYSPADRILSMDMVRARTAISG